MLCRSFGTYIMLLLIHCRSDSSSDSEREASSRSKGHKDTDKHKKVSGFFFVTT